MIGIYTVVMDLNVLIAMAGSQSRTFILIRAIYVRERYVFLNRSEAIAP